VCRAEALSHLEQVRELGVAVGDVVGGGAALLRERLDDAAQRHQRPIDLLGLLQAVPRRLRLLLPLAACVII